MLRTKVYMSMGDWALIICDILYLFYIFYLEEEGRKSLWPRGAWCRRLGTPMQTRDADGGEQKAESRQRA